MHSALAAAAEIAWNNIIDAADVDTAQALLDVFSARNLEQQRDLVLACSPFAAEVAKRKPVLLLDLLKSGDLHSAFSEQRFADDLQRQLQAAGAELSSVLRRFRQRHMLRIVWRDFSRLADTRETTRDTSLLAEACIAAAQSHLYAELVEKHGTPIGRDSGEPQQLIVLAMGKLGARELNISSDIDLIFTYPESGQTDGDSKPLSNEEFFTALGRGIIQALDANTVDGFVFRVDMRLRPYGDSGALVHNFAALEGYYQEQGRDWERYAMIKARPITGNELARNELMETLRPFVYRKYVDFGVIESLRKMKQMIVAEELRRGLEDDVKLGAGGIREVEFIAQCFQLIRGGREPKLRERELLVILEACVALGILPAEAERELRDAYLFLRDTEHGIQGFQDKQTQSLPEEDFARAALSTVLGFDDWDKFVTALDDHRSKVKRHFSDLIAAPDDEPPSQQGQRDRLWGDAVDGEAYTSLGFLKVDESLQAVVSLRTHPRVETLQQEGRDRLDDFMPRLIQACAEVDNPDLALQRVLPLVLSVVRRSAYLALLLENPPALGELVLLCGASPWISDQLERYPVLLDELLDRASLYTAPDKDLLRNELRQQVARLPLQDLEAQMDALRYFKASHVLRVAASELAGRLPLMQVSDKLTWIAEVILEQVLAVAWNDLAGKYGEPARPGPGMGFAAYAYGKLGGLELGYGSDLDLVFIYHDGRGSTDGERSIDNAVFYTRLGQRVIHILETRMNLGQLYEVDMRLRPAGSSGMLVTTVAGFEAYQKNDAWTWEHQALVRARFVAGDERLASDIDEVRERTLCQPRNEVRLAEEVREMREKMRAHLLPSQPEHAVEFDLKQGAGGIVDIEFMVQYAVLAWSASEPGLTRWSDNVRILQALGREGFFKQPECEALTQAYLAYRSAAHQLALQQAPGVVSAEEFAAERKVVIAKWCELFGQSERDPVSD